MGYLSGYWVLSILLTGFVASVKGQCDGSAQKFPDQNKEISSPNFNDGGEYSKSANCSWEFSPRSDAKEYALVLTFKQLRLFVVKIGTKHCLGSYNLSINEEQTNCVRYAGTENRADGTISYDFCNAFYSSPTCANTSQSQRCEKTLQTPYPVSVTYYSDGRTDPDVASAVIYFRIGYEFIPCPAVPTANDATITATTTTASTAAASATTPATITTTTATKATTTTTPATTTPATTTTVSASTITIAATTTMQQITHHTTQSDENETGTQMPSSNATRSNLISAISNFTAEGNSGNRQDVMVAIAASAGGGCLVLIAGIAVMLFLRKRKMKLDISTGRRDQDLPMAEIEQSNDSTGSNTATMAGKPSQTNQSKPTEDATARELYATVSKSPKDKNSPDSPEGHVTENQDQSNQGHSEVTTLSQSEGFVYTTINIKKNEREAAHSSKDMDEAE